jgi:serine/threonine protein kinase
VASNGNVYLIEKNNQQFILKSKNTSKMSEKELTILNLLKDYKYVTQLVEYKLTVSQIYMIMSYGKHGTLIEFAKSSNYFDSYDNIIQFFIKLFEGVQNIQNVGYVHTDLKLDNIIVDENYEPKIINFELAVEMNTIDLPRGTIGYMAPEVFQHFVSEDLVLFTGSVDLFSLSVIFYEIVKGKRPINIDILNYNDLLDAKISFSAGDRKEFFEFIYQTITPLSQRTSLKHARHLMKNMYRTLEPNLLGKPKSYTLRELANENELKMSGNKMDRLTYILLALTVIVFFAVFIYFILFYMKSRKKGHFHTSTTVSEFMSTDSQFQTHSEGGFHSAQK